MKVYEPGKNNLVAKFNKMVQIAGRSSSQIERAKRMAVGGKRKRCTKGKSCSASCIANNKVCLVEIPWVMVGEIEKAREEIVKVITPKPTPKPQLSETDIANTVKVVMYYANKYEELDKKKKQTDAIKESKAFYVKKIEDSIAKLPEGEAKTKARNYADLKLGKPNIDNDRKAVNDGIKDAVFWHKMGQPEKAEVHEKQAKAAIAKLPESERAQALKRLNDSVEEAKKLKEAANDAEKKLKERAPTEVLKVINKHVKTMEEEYAKLAELQKQNLPSGEEWRIKTAQDNAKIALEKALMETKYLPADMRIKAANTVNSRAIAAQSSSMTPKEREVAIERLITRYRYAKLGQSPDSDEVQGLRSQILSLAGGFTGAKKDKMMAKINKALGELKPLVIDRKTEDPTEIAKLGKDTVDKFSRLRSAKSILDRYDRIQKVIKDRITGIDTTAAQRERLSEQWLKADYMKNSAIDKMVKAMSELRTEMLKTTLTPAQIKEAMNRVEFVKGKGIAQARKDVEEYLKMFNGRGITDVDGAMGKPLFRVEMTNKRAGAQVLRGHITTDGVRSTTFHEITHLAEVQKLWMVQYAVNWRNKQAFTEQQAQENGIKSPKVGGVGTKPLFRLADITGGGYRQDEVAFADSYLHPYMGKVYEGANSTSTEVWTMALQHFASVNDMVKLYRAHPDLFEMGVGLAKS